MSDWIIILGGRSAALDAANALSLNSLLVTEPNTVKRVLKKASAFIEIPLRTEPTQIMAQVLQKLDGIVPMAIIAASEQGVLPAAFLRTHFSLPGQSIDSARDALIKSRMKQRFIDANLPCWPTFAVTSVAQAVEVAQPIGYPLIVKALASSGSRGVKKIRDRAHLRRVIKRMLLKPEYGGIGIEPFCGAKECSLELIIQDGTILFSNITQYLEPGKTNLLPAKFSRQFSERLMQLSKAVQAAFDFSHGMLHIEFYYKENEIWLGEVNARPPGGGLMMLIKQAYQFEPWQLFIQSQFKKPVKPTQYQRHNYLANWFIHPGKGIVKKIEGYDAIDNHPLKLSFNLKVTVGQKVNYRYGTGSSVGELILIGKDKLVLEKAMDDCTQTLKIKMMDTNDAQRSDC